MMLGYCEMFWVSTQGALRCTISYLLIVFDIMNSKEPPHYPCTFLNGTRALTQVLYTMVTTTLGRYEYEYEYDGTFYYSNPLR